jgi:hypothetical protein
MFRWVRAFCDEASFPLLSTPKSLFTIASIREQEPLLTLKTRVTQNRNDPATDSTSQMERNEKYAENNE